MTNPLPFICIGQARAGTTWLSELLASTSAYFQPPVKEWNYLSALFYARRELTYDELLKHRVARRALFYKEALISYSEQFVALDAKHLKSKGVNDHLNWWMHYLMCGLSLKNYRTLLFENDKPTYDISPEYCRIDPAILTGLLDSEPSLRLVILLRHPPSRYRSHLNLMRHNTQEELDHIRDHSLISPMIHALGNYGARVFVGFNDDIRLRPDDLSSALAGFLNIDAPLTIPPAGVNASTKSQPINDIGPISRYLASEMTLLNKLLPGNWPAFWLSARDLDSMDGYNSKASTVPCGSGTLDNLRSGR